MMEGLLNLQDCPLFLDYILLQLSILKHTHMKLWQSTYRLSLVLLLFIVSLAGRVKI